MCSIDCHKRPLPLKFSQIQHKGKSDVFAAFKTASSSDGNKTKQDGLQKFNPLSKLQVDCYWPFAVRNCYLDVRNCYLEFEGRRARRRERCSKRRIRCRARRRERCSKRRWRERCSKRRCTKIDCVRVCAGLTLVRLWCYLHVYL